MYKEQLEVGMFNLQQTDKKNKQELINLAIKFYTQLLEQKYPEEKAKEEVRQKTGVVI